MSDLVEKVARAICARRIDEVGLGDALPDSRDVDLRWGIFVPEARAAIRSVLSHFAEAGNVTDGMVNAFIEEEEEKRGSTEADCLYAGIAAAMAAALNEMEPKP